LTSRASDHRPKSGANSSAEKPIAARQKASTKGRASAVAQFAGEITEGVECISCSRDTVARKYERVLAFVAEGVALLRQPLGEA